MRLFGTVQMPLETRLYMITLEERLRSLWAQREGEMQINYNIVRKGNRNAPGGPKSNELNI